MLRSSTLLDAGQRLVQRHCADGHGRVAQDGFANHRNVAACGQVHDGVGAEVDGGVELAQLFVDVGGRARSCRCWR